VRAVPFCSGLCHMLTLGRSVPAHAVLTPPPWIPTPMYFIRSLKPRVPQFLDRPNAIRDASLHCGRHAKCLVNAPEVVIHEVERDGCGVASRER